MTKTFVLIGVALTALAGCSSTSDEPSTRERFLKDWRAVDADAFVNDDAALGYLKNYCQSLAVGTPATPDEIDRVVASYCTTDLAIELGVTTLPPVGDGIDEDAFRAEAIERFQIGVPESDGSAIDAVAFARTLCAGDVTDMIATLGDDFAGSFQELALSTFCPDKLP
ncbi:MAG: hypothetical protein HY826_02460 [Actinobacteria bacterium]|nr:hypothetical protein [Actinomycetota bacterium]